MTLEYINSSMDDHVESVHANQTSSVPTDTAFSFHANGRRSLGDTTISVCTPGQGVCSIPLSFVPVPSLIPFPLLNTRMEEVAHYLFTLCMIASVSSCPITASPTSNSHFLFVLSHYERNPCHPVRHSSPTLPTSTTFASIHLPRKHLLPWVVTPLRPTLSSCL